MGAADDGGGLKLTSQARAALMSRLATNAGLAPPTLPTALNPVPVVPAVPVQPQVLVSCLECQELRKAADRCATGRKTSERTILTQLLTLR